MNKCKLGINFIIIGIILVIIGIILPVHAAETNNDKILIATGTSGEIYIVKSSIRQIKDQPLMFGQVAFNLEIEDGLYERSTAAFITNCGGFDSSLYKTDLIYGHDGEFDPDKDPRGGQDLWLMLVTQQITQTICDMDYSGLTISFDEVRKLVLEYYHAPN